MLRINRWTALGLALTCILLTQVPHFVGLGYPGASFNMRSTGGTLFNSYSIQVATNAFAVLAAVILPFAAFRWRVRDLRDLETPPVGVLHRAVAGFIDIIGSYLVVLGLGAFFFLIIEWISTGQFYWGFRRLVPRTTDHLAWPLAIAAIIAPAAYNAWSLITEKPTLGQYAMGFRMINDPDKGYRSFPVMQVILMGLFGWVGPLWLAIAFFDKGKKRVWWSIVTNIRPIRQEAGTP
ncbi:MAG: hypothetical protein GYB36_08140 [Alphaproteobacteria bacterium]|nr:hypothetical protein [Alphaproteobacteria bacterium]